MKNKIKIITGIILVGIAILLFIGVAVAQGLISIPFTTPSTDDKIAKCGSDIQCWGDVESDGTFARFFTVIHEDGSTEKIILIEEFPVEGKLVEEK